MGRIVVASNRGPISFADDGTVRRGAGGVASILASLMTGPDRVMVAAAMTDGDRAFTAGAPGQVQVAGNGAGEHHVRLLHISPADYHEYYDVVSNRFLWYALHRLFDPVRRPILDRDAHEAFERYLAVNRAFAAVCAEEVDEGDRLLVQDYHLAAVPGLARAAGVGGRIAHFSHTAWPRPQALTLLPDRWVREIVGGILGADLVGFHSRRWAGNFVEVAEEVCGARAVPGGIEFGGRRVAIDCFPLGPDPDVLAAEVADPDTEEAGRELDDLIDGRRLVLRIERLDPAKNTLRGLLAYERFLEDHADARHDVVHLAQAYPSREQAPEYIAYRDAVEEVADRISTRFPKSLAVFREDNFPRTIAAYQRYDVLVVNSIADGLNLVAKEGAVVNRRDGVIVLSRDAGAVDQLEGSAFVVNPYDTSETAAAIATALSIPAAERRRRSAESRAASLSCSPTTWLDGQVAALESSASQRTQT